MANEFATPIDIANRALQHLGGRRIDPNLGFAEVSKNATEIAACYDKLRVAELSRTPWKFAIKRAVIRPVNAVALSGVPFSITPPNSSFPVAPTMVILPALWSELFTYSLGQLVSDQTGNIWECVVPSTVAPGNAPGYSTAWRQYFGPMTADYFNNSPIVPFAFYAGELVYNFVGDGSYTVYKSMMNANAAPPPILQPWSGTQVYAQDETAIVYPAWSSGTTYGPGAAVLASDGNTYASLSGGNLNNPPSSVSTVWAVLPTKTDPNGLTISAIGEYSSQTTYIRGNFVDYGGVLYVQTSPTGIIGINPPVGGSGFFALTGGVVYQSLVELNLGNAPATSPTQWTTTITSGTGSIAWRTISVMLQSLALMYPLGSGPSWQSTFRKAFRLPANYLARAPQDPKAGAISRLGAPGQLLADDWEIEGDYLVSDTHAPITLRFIGNVTQVTSMHPMFCEGLACRIAMEVAEPLAFSGAKKEQAGAYYKAFMGEARLRNAIEIGAEEQPLDDWVACRT